MCNIFWLINLKCEIVWSQEYGHASQWFKFIIAISEGHLVTISAKLFSTSFIGFREDFVSLFYKHIRETAPCPTAIFFQPVLEESNLASILSKLFSVLNICFSGVFF